MAKMDYIAQRTLVVITIYLCHSLGCICLPRQKRKKNDDGASVILYNYFGKQIHMKTLSL